jgi:predicted nicotinamide N-methyase
MGGYFTGCPRAVIVCVLPSGAARMKNRTSLEQQLQRIIPGACLERVPLPDVPEINLWLMNRDYPQDELSAAEVKQVMEHPLYWVFCWASGQVLARYLLDNPGLVRGRRVLDFGCGSGVVAIAAALAGAAEVVACDLDPLALAATRLNAEENGVALSLADEFGTVTGHLDLIIVADVLYDRENFSWLQRFIDRAEQVLIADSRVKNFDHPPYIQIGRRESCTIPDLDESSEFRDVRIYLAD